MSALRVAAAVPVAPHPLVHGIVALQRDAATLGQTLAALVDAGARWEGDGSAGGAADAVVVLDGSAEPAEAARFAAALIDGARRAAQDGLARRTMQSQRQRRRA